MRIMKAAPVILVAVLLLFSACEKKYEEGSTRATTTAEAPAPAATSSYELTDKDRETLLRIARETLDAWVRENKILDFDVPDGVLTKNGAAFVTLRINGQLRGCIGHTVAQEPLWMCVRDMAIAASSRDRRFMPVMPDELDRITVEVSVLTPPQEVAKPSDIVLGRDGVIVKYGIRSGVFLPQVATETGWERDTFLAQLCTQKAGLSPDCYNDPRVKLLSFQAIVFEEKE